jgi:carboxypeptidase C (cathepsin A)
MQMKRWIVSAAAVAIASAALVAQQAPAEKPADKPAEKAADLPPLPRDAHVSQSIQLGGKTLNYTATVGTIPVYGSDNKKTGEVVFTSYTMDGADRAVTFALNGGPGAASVYLNFGAIGPKRVPFGEEGNSPSDPATLSDNPGTWLDFTDLVFIDPIGTGFSRSLVSADQTKKDFYTTENDIQYLSRAIYDWLLKNKRMAGRKYLVGESYGGYRVPRLTHYLQAQLGVAMNGIVPVSPYLNPAIDENGDISPLPWIVTLPSIAAANLERKHQLSAETMAPVIAYARGEYAVDLLKGRSDPLALARIVDKVSDLTGLDKTFVRRSGGRIDIGAYLREVFRNEGKIGSVYDSNVTSFDPFPFAPESISVRARTAQQRSAAREHHRADDDGDGGFRDARRRVERGRALQRAQLRRRIEMGSRQRGVAQGRGRGSARSGRGRPEAARPDRARLERSVMPVHGLDPVGRSDAGDGRCDARERARVSGRPHVLRTQRQPGGAAQGRRADVLASLGRR